MSRLVFPTRVRVRVALGRATAGAIWAITALWRAPAAYAEGRESASRSVVAKPRGSWPDSVVATARSLPIQEGGRLMPLAQWARYTLLRLNHKDSLKDATGRSLEPVEWALDVMFRPEEAAKYDVFVVDTSEVLDGVGYKSVGAKKKRDRYSYYDLEPVQKSLFDRAKDYSWIDAKARSPVQDETIALAGNVRMFVALANLLECAKFEFAIEPSSTLKSVFGAATSVRASDVLSHLSDLASAGGDKDGARVKDVATLLGECGDAFAAGHLLAFVPPAGDRESEAVWYTPRDLFDRALTRRELETPQIALLQDLETAVRAAESDDMTTWTRAFLSAHERVTDRAYARGEGRWIGLEVDLLRLDPFSWARLLYLIAFLVVAASWLWPKRVVVASAWGLLFAGLAIHAAGITMRCVIQGHPPVKSLYETTLFISWCGVGLALVVERISRRGFALALAPIFGVVSLLVSTGYETKTGEDTMAPLQAVLDTNFWLTIHVLCISLGYCVTLISSFIAHVHVGVRALRPDPELERTIARYTYGTMAFGLLLSTVGTILGGVWANDSWGRFWGWDPKENGALMIVLAQLAVLHGRMGGMLSPFGVSLGAIASGCVVAFSWWGVNLLGVGQHSYGFTAGLWSGLMTFWGIEAAVLAIGIWAGRRRPATKLAGASAPAAV